MKFFRKNENPNEYIDSIFTVVNAAKQDKSETTINGTAGCLSGEDGKLFVYNSVFANESQIESRRKAAYASSPSGNKEFVEAMCKYILDGRVNNNYAGIATVGGTGAIYAAVKMFLDEGETILYPEIAWGNYKVIAQENNLNALTYDDYNLDDLCNKIDMCGERVFLLINSPCENPLGHSYTVGEWHKIFEKINNCDKEVILLIDNAYMDYAYNDPKAFFPEFNNISDNVLVLIAASCSKSFSYYGVRLGALIGINNDVEFIKKFENLASRLARTTWSNCSNGAMINVTEMLTNHYDEYIKERDDSKLMLKKRSDLFIEQAKQCGLETYPYTEGFFVTLKVEDLGKRDEIHSRLMENHIYTIKVNKGIRVGICSIPLAKIDGLAKRIKDLM